ncbi:glycosyltransferase family 2 protein [Limnoglobus roseus]|uniref:GT2 family glycosyltransferase n=1 Tax=Limnoglobus roseus TaxID=2598579 RepID=A0A5C1A4D4_9BACT|nr:glycosyltransferase family 2 protein [Limnoglobus roseus]QEL13500.1 GT2 family glycosyltransferase [Limnoglobus roseus]
MTVLAIVAFLFALGPATLYFRNTRLFREPPEIPAESFRISVLIPARNEEAGIADCVEAVLASRVVELECVVLDDHSDDRTAAIVQEMARKDSRLRLETAPPLPAGWSGKQHACHCLAQLATFPLLNFLDADVRLAPDALARMAAFQHTSGAAIVSGFPRQETGTFFEKLLIPLIHFLLLGFLPFKWMRRSTRPGFGAGCGQWFLTPRDAYDRVGGHAHLSVRNSFHDGVRLPRAYRANGLMTDLCDVTALATCRMYRTAGQVWNGLAKNAREGLAAPKLILFSTLMLFCGQVLPFVLLPFADGWPLVLAAAACAFALLPRVHGAIRFRQSGLGATLHPLGVTALLAIQWYATVRAVLGRPVGWKGRTKPNAGD